MKIMMPAFFRSAATVCFVTLLACHLLAQNPTGTITGILTDPTNAVVPQAKVTVTNQGTGLVRETTSNEAGEYRAPWLPVGAYSVRAEATGFKTVIQRDVNLEVEQVVRLDFKMELGTVQNVISVTAQTPLLQTESSSSGEVIRNVQVENLPLNVRQWTNLTYLTPFSVPATNDFNSQSLPRDTVVPAVAGQRAELNNYQIDGFDDRESGLNNISVNPPIDAIAEFKVQSGVAPAEFGRTAGTVINVASKGGTNSLHGTLYEFLRNDAADADSYFGHSKSPLKRNQFGAALGGPIVKNKVLVFGNYEGFRERSGGGPVVGNVPSANDRQGVFTSQVVNPLNCTTPGVKSTCQAFPNSGGTWQIPQGSINPISTSILGLFPTANQAAGTFNYIFQPPASPTRRDKGATRVDYNIRTSDTLYGRYIINDESVATPETFPSGIGGTVFTLRAYTVGGHENHVFNPHLVNDAGFNYMSFNNLTVAQLANTTNYFKQFGILDVYADTDPRGTGAPYISIPGYILMSDTLPGYWYSGNYEAVDNLSWQKGRHSLKMGGDFRRINTTNFSTGLNAQYSYNNQYSGNYFADFLLGLPSNVSKTAVAKPYGGNLNYIGAYFQDDWKVTPRLTVNFGVRYEVETALSQPGAHDLPDFDVTTGTMLFENSIASKAAIQSFYANVRPDIKIGFIPNNTAYDTDTNNVAPRFGFAYQARPRMVVRGGFGIYYSSPETSWAASGNDFAPNTARPIWTGDSVLPVIDLPNGTQIPDGYNPEGNGGVTAAVAYPTPLTIFPQLGRSFPYGYTQQWLLSWQNQLTNNMMLDIEYLGSRTNHLQGYTNADVAPSPSALPVQSRLEFPSFARIQGVVSGNSATFHGLAVNLEKRYSHGLTLTANYTWSKAMDTSSTFISGPSWIDPAHQQQTAKGPTGFNAPNRFVASYQYELPLGRGKSFGGSMPAYADKIIGGWGVRGITSFQTGLPSSPSMALNRTNICAADCTARPFRVGPGNLSKSVRTQDGLSPSTSVAFWNYNDFVRPAANAPAIGNAGRDILYGPGTNNWDLGVFKDFRITESKIVEFRYEAFNTWNHPQFLSPSSSVNSQATFGKLTGTTPMRISQFTLKLDF